MFRPARRAGRLRRRLTTLLVATALVASGVSALVAPVGADETTISTDTLRTAWDPAEPSLGAAGVTASDFGELFSTTLPAAAGTSANQVYAQPLVADGKVFVATEENQVDALDPRTGAVLWSTPLGPSWPASTAGCGDLVPDIGITSTPVFDPGTRTLYVTTKTNDGPDPQHPNYRLHALDSATGADRPGWPIRISGSPSNGGPAFNAATSHQRPGLLLLGGSVYMGFASHCDHAPYVGYVVGVNTTTTATTLWSTETQTSTAEAGVWQSGGGLVSDGPGRILVVTGNGVSPPPGPGTAPPGTLAESVVRLKVASNGTLSAPGLLQSVQQRQARRGRRRPGLRGAHRAAGLLRDVDAIRTSPSWRARAPCSTCSTATTSAGPAQGPGGTDRVLDAATLPNGLVGARGGVQRHGERACTDQLPLPRPDGSAAQVYSVSADGRASRGSRRWGSHRTPSATPRGPRWSPPTASTRPRRRSGWSAPAICPAATVSSSPTTRSPRRPRQEFVAPLGTVAKFVQPATVIGRVVGTRDGRVPGFVPTDDPA